MLQKPKAVKYKVIAGYILLFTIAVVSVWFVYTEISKIALTGKAEDDNKKIIQISNAIADLYASEAIGRSSILTSSPKDYRRYIQIIDSIDFEIETIKKDVDKPQIPKFDSIQLLLERKKNSVTELVKLRKGITGETAFPFQKAIYGIYKVKDSIKDQVKPVVSTKPYQWRDLVRSILTPRQLDSLSKLPVSNDSLAMAFDNLLSDYLVKDHRVRNELLKKEQKLLEENYSISEQLRVILSSVENDLLRKSYQKIRQSQEAIEKTTNTIAWVGAATLFILILFAWIIIRDLTNNQNYRKQLELLNNENEELLRSKSMLMATVTHDLQTPLGSIIGFNDLLKESGVNNRQQQYVNNIRESADYILRLVNDLLDFSKLENNKITIDKVAFNIKQLIEGTCRTLEPSALKKNIELTWDIEDDLDNNFISDPYRIKQVLTNLISNAIKFTNEGSVEVIAKIEDDAICISVLDTGIGIAQGKHKVVFKEFTQAHTGIEKKFGGTGLGLTISKRILRLLDGSISLESEEGKGSIFTIKLPCIPAEDTAAEAINSSSNDNVLPFIRNKSILIIDDDAVQLALMKELFNNYPVNVTTEINPSSVLSVLEQKHFDLILSDIQMPVLNGFDLVKNIREHPKADIATIPVIALSGKRDLTSNDFLKAGFTASHAKPIQFEQLLVLISNIFGNNGVSEAKTATASGAAPLYNLRSLSQFTNNDPDSLKTILRTFIDSAYDNCDLLKESANTGDRQRLAETAHKMIPMLRQMEVHSIADLLIPLEDNTLVITNNELKEYVDDVCSRMHELISGFEREIA